MAETKQPSWGHLEKRFGGKAQDNPRKLLALDGGGIRGVLTLQVLIRMEELLRERSGQGDDFRLCNFFDYIGGTSTGAIIAAGLAIGMSAKELSDFYIATGLGVGAAMMLTAALMGLVFLSSGTGHDESVTDLMDDDEWKS